MILLHLSLGAARTGLPRSAEETLRIMKGKLKIYARHLLSSETGLRLDQNLALQEFFDLSLSHDPNERQMSLLTFLGKLDSQR